MVSCEVFPHVKMLQDVFQVNPVLFIQFSVSSVTLQTSDDSAPKTSLKGQHPLKRPTK